MQVSGHHYHIQGILFDKDGTLLDLHSLWNSWFDQFYETISNQQVVSKSELAEFIGLDIENKIVSPRGPLAIGTVEDIAIIAALYLYRQKLSWNEAVQTSRNSIQEVNATIDWDRYLQPLQGLSAFLEKARQSGVKMGVVTSDDTDIAEQHLHLLNIHDYFQSIIGSDQIVNPKPFPDIGDKACQEMMIDPESVVVIGDTNGDMKLGKNLKAKANIGIVSSADEDESHLTEANYIINHYEMLDIT